MQTTFLCESAVGDISRVLDTLRRMGIELTAIEAKPKGDMMAVVLEVAEGDDRLLRTFCRRLALISGVRDIRTMPALDTCVVRD